MRGSVKVIGLGILVVAAAIALRVSDKHSSMPSAVTASTQPHGGKSEFVPQSSPPAPSGPSASPTSISDRQAETTDDPPGCLTPEQVETHPLVLAELETLESVMSIGNQFDAYRQLGVVELESLAIQGDSAAMVMLGDKAVEQALGPPSRTTSFSSGAINSLLTVQNTRSKPLSAAEVSALEAARDWYYDAALHGRLGALAQYGLVRHVLEGNAVDLGWMPAAEYDQLSQGQQSSVRPATIYERVGHMARPGVTELFGGQLISRPTDLQRPIVDRLAQEFVRDRAARGFPDFEPLRAAISDREEILRLVCPSLRDDL